MRHNHLIALTATAGSLRHECSAHKVATGTTPGASTTPATTVVPQGVWQIQDLTALSGAQWLSLAASTATSPGRMTPSA